MSFALLKILNFLQNKKKKIFLDNNHINGKSIYT